MDSTIAAVLTLDGVGNGAVYALLGMAIALVFAVTRVILIPQGEFVAYSALTLAMLGAGDGVNLTLAWVYVGMRVVHSLVQALINKIELRFAIFFLSSLVLVGLIVNAVRIICG